MKGIFFQIYDINKKITFHSNEWLLEIYRLAVQDQIYPRNFLQTADSDIIVSLHLVILSNLWQQPSWLHPNLNVSLVSSPKSTSRNWSVTSDTVETPTTGWTPCGLKPFTSSPESGSTMMLFLPRSESSSLTYQALWWVKATIWVKI